MVSRHIAVLMIVMCVPAAAASPGELEQALDLLEAVEHQTISIDRVETPVGVVLESLTASSPAPLRGDWAALDVVGIRSRDPVTVQLDDVSLSTALAAILLQLGDAYERPRLETHRGLLLVTTEEGAAKMRLTEVYDVRDLLAADRVVERLRDEAPPIPVDGDDARGPSPSRADPDEPVDEGEAKFGSLPEPLDVDDLLEARPPRPLTPGEELMTLIAEHVDPEAWMEFGGATASITERDGVLLVSAPATTHRTFVDALRRLRRSNPTSVDIDVAIVDIERDALDRLTRRHERSSRSFARVIMAAGAPVWRSSASAALGEQVELEAADAGGSIELDLRPVIDDATGTLTLVIALQAVRGDDRRRLTTSTTVPNRDGAAVLEIPPAAVSETVRVLVVVPGRR